MRCIAEFGQNNRGSLDTAKRQADAAKKAGCWAAKWQLFQFERLASPAAKRYWDARLGGSDTQLETFRDNKMLFREQEWAQLRQHCADIGIEFLCTPFDLEAVDTLEVIGVSYYKVASGDVTYKDLIDKIAKTSKTVILSTGAAHMWEINQALRWLCNVPVVLLACDLVYPCPDGNANLSRIEMLRKHPRPIAVGYSDHTVGFETGLAAAALGATYLEKHVTLDPHGGVPDDRMALTPAELELYVELARRGEMMRGTSLPFPSDAEAAARIGARRALYAARHMPAGEEFQAGDFIALRPCPKNGLPPFEAERLYGVKIWRDFEAGELIS